MKKGLVTWLIIAGLLATCVVAMGSSDDVANTPTMATETFEPDNPEPENALSDSPPVQVAQVEPEIDRREQFTVRADPGVTYYIVGAVRRVSPEVVEVTTERDSPRGGKSYAIREVNCVDMHARYIGNSDSLAEAVSDAEARTYVGNFAPLVSGSSTDTVARRACRLADQ